MFEFIAEFIVQFIVQYIFTFPGAFIIWMFMGFRKNYFDIINDYEFFSMITGIATFILVAFLVTKF